MSFDVNVINPFLTSAKDVIKITTGIELEIGKPSLKDLVFTDEYVRIMLGITGEMTGQIIIVITTDGAKNIASKMMMGMPVNELDEMAISAISELGNMIMGNASTILEKNSIKTDITPPMVERGNSKIDMDKFQSICVPLLYENTPFIELDIMVKKVS